MSATEPTEDTRAHPLEPLVLEQVDPRARGRAHGEHWRQAIHELAELRLRLALRHGGLGDAGEVLDAAALHLPVLHRALPQLAEELEGIAEGAALSPARVLALNLDADLQGLPRSVLGKAPVDPPPHAVPETDPGGATAIYLHGVRGPLLGETWDLPACVEPFVRMLRIAPAGGEHEVLCLTLAGCLGVAGLSSRGVAATMLDLRCTDGRVGVAWPAVLRAMLEQSHARAAYELLLRTPLGGGHHSVLADGHDYYGVEASAELKVLTQLGPRAAHLHTNHCFDPVLRRREAVRRGSTTFHRLNLVTTLYAQARPRDAEGLWSLLHTRDGSPGSPLVDPPEPRGEATATCAVIVMRLRDGWMRVVRGGAHRSPPLELHVGRWQGQPAPGAAAIG